MSNGVDYFPLDVTLNDRFELIEAEFGLTGFAVVVKLFQKIYGGQGYYCEWNDEVALLFARKVGLGGNAVSEIVSASVKRGIFDKTLYDKYAILTSEGIQERYFKAVSRRKSVEVEKRYLLCNCIHFLKNVDIIYKNADISAENVYTIEQSKGKESRVKDSRVKENKELAAAVRAYEQNIGTCSATVGEMLEYWLSEVSLSLIEYAIEQAARYNKQNWNYIETILKAKHSAGQKTREAAEAKKSVKKKDASYELDDMAAMERKMRLAKMNKEDNNA